MAFRNRKTLKKNKYTKKTAKRRTWKGKGAAPPPSRRIPPPVFMEPAPRSPTGHSVPMGNLSPIRVSTHTPTLSDVEDSFSFTPTASPNRSRSISRPRQ